LPYEKTTEQMTEKLKEERGKSAIMTQSIGKEFTLNLSEV